MALVNSFREQARAVALVAALTAAPLFAQAADAPKPANTNAPAATPVTTAVVNNTSTNAPAYRAPTTQIGKAAEFSEKGVSLIIIVGKDDNAAKYQREVRAFQGALKNQNIPNMVVGVRSQAPDTYAYLVVNRVTMNGTGEAADYGKGYDLTKDWALIHATAKRAWQEAFGKTASTVSTETGINSRGASKTKFLPMHSAPTTTLSR